MYTIFCTLIPYWREDYSIPGILLFYTQRQKILCITSKFTDGEKCFIISIKSSVKPGKIQFLSVKARPRQALFFQKITWLSYLILSVISISIFSCVYVGRTQIYSIAPINHTSTSYIFIGFRRKSTRRYQYSKNFPRLNTEANFPLNFPFFKCYVFTVQYYGELHHQKASWNHRHSDRIPSSLSGMFSIKTIKMLWVLLMNYCLTFSDHSDILTVWYPSFLLYLLFLAL